MRLKGQTVSTAQQLQTNNLTFLGRHWTEHCVLRRYFDSDRDLSILSFGCSTGEELLSMKALFPGARLFGCDVDWHNLLKARALLGNDALVFQSSDAAIRAHGPFDIILCNSVLLASATGPKAPPSGISPALWSDVLSLLDSALKPGGVLQIINSNIPFRFHPIHAQYQALPSTLFNGPNFVDLFDLNGVHLCAGVSGVGWSGMLHRHLAREGWKQLIPADLEDIHFRKSGGAELAPPANDERIPNLLACKSLASGTTSYRPTIPSGESASSYTEVDVAWHALGVDAVRLERVAQRIWFDGTHASTKTATVDMTGPEATAFLESTMGRRSSRLSFESVLNAKAIRSASF